LPIPDVASTVIAQKRPKTAVQVSRGGSEKKSNELITWEFLRMYFTEVQAAGIMGNLKQEHNFFTTGNGICQWEEGRFEKLKEYPGNETLQGQLSFMQEELQGPYNEVYESLKRASTIEEATIIFQNKFERPSIPVQSQRIKYAEEIYKKYANN
jgi:hypothetical protein